MSSEEESEVEWEDVERLELGVKQEPTTSQAALEVQVVLQPQEKKGAKKNFLERALAAYSRTLQQNLHKTHLLCLLANGLQQSRQCDEETVQAVVLSMLPSNLLPSPPASDSLQRLLVWYKEDAQALIKALRAEHSLSAVQVLVVLLRAIGLRARLVLSLTPIPFKATHPLHVISVEGAGLVGGAQCSSKPSMEKGFPDQPVELSQPSPIKEMPSCSPGANREGCPAPPTRKRSADSKRGGRGRKRSKLQPEEGGEGVEIQMVPEDPKRKRRKNEPSLKEGTRPQENTSTSSRSVEVSARRHKGSEPPSPSDRRRSLRSHDSAANDGKLGELGELGGGSIYDGGSDVGKDFKGKRRKKEQSVSPWCKGGAGDPVDDVSLGRGGPPTEPGGVESPFLYDENSSWTEVFLGRDQGRWVCLHLSSCSVDSPQLCERHAPHPSTYVIGIENGRVRDVTPRYASNWCTSTRRMRLSEDWWKETLEPYAVEQEEGVAEDRDILNILYSQPLPMTVADYKGHPLYALKRHLLKFEAIYPGDSMTVGQCKGEAVYERKCVYTLHSRESWLKEARVVKKGQTAYKVVKARKQDKVPRPSGGEGPTLELFGIWQTEVYIPPPVVDGKVPRNEYGNIELFHPSMLPQGACHMRVPGIQRVARKLGVDYAQAMIGWDFHGGGSHPVFDGIVVAVECRNVLAEAAEQDEQVSIEKDLKKREQRVLDRWKKLCRGLVIMERVKKTYNFAQES